MLWTRSGRTLKRVQIVWILVWVLSLADNIAGESSTITPELTNPTRTTDKPQTSPAPTTPPTETTNTPVSIFTTKDTTVVTVKTTQITAESAPTTNHSWPLISTSTSPSLDLQNETTSSTLSNSTAAITSSVTLLTSGHTVQSTLTPPSSPPSTLPGPENKTVLTHVGCLNIRNFRDSIDVICLELNESVTCESSKAEKRNELGKMLCELPNSTFLRSGQCHLQLSTSEVNPKYLLLILTKNDDARQAFDAIQKQMSTLQQMGIQQCKLEKVYDHLDRTRKTLIALITCGLLLTAIVLAGFFLSNRQSWSPGRQRLGEELYYTENDSQDNTVLSMVSNDQSQLQEKPNLNGGTQENGTGQTVTTTATNGHSTRQHVVADTEL